MRLIDADAIIKELEEMSNNEWNISVGSSKGLNDAIDVIDNAPTVETKTIADCIIAYGDGYETARRLSERPQGEWIFQYTFLDDNLYKCSSCDRLLSIDVEQDIAQFLFCPNCGAKMGNIK